MMESHRTLQRLFILFAFGMLVGISDAGTDPRNETAVDSARKVKKMLEDGEFPFGRFV